MTRADDLFPTYVQFRTALRALRVDVNEHSVSIGYRGTRQRLIVAQFCAQFLTDQYLAQALADALSASVPDERGTYSIPLREVLDRATRAREAA